MDYATYAISFNSPKRKCSKAGPVIIFRELHYSQRSLVGA
jgi:hypothetical protein